MLQKIGFLPGINKQITAPTAEGQWVDCDNVRFRYSTPEKIGGWKQLGADNVSGAARGLHQFTNSAGQKYSIIGTNRVLYAYSGGVFYDIHPIKSTTTLTNAFSTTNGSASVTINFSGDHGIQAGDIILLDNFTAITNSNYAAANFDDIRFMVTTVPSSNTITITMPSNESGSGASESGGIRVRLYYHVGPDVQAQGFGWSLGTWGGQEVGAFTTTLSSGITDSATSITLNDASQFPSSGTNYIQIGTEEISYTGITARLTTRASMLTSGFETRIDAATDTGNPTATRVTLISPTTRHLIHLGTETTIGSPDTQDDMFIRFSEDENINKYTPQATNTAGTQRLQDGTKIMGGLVAKENILIWTDNALYTMKFVGAPFTFGFEQVGTNCGLIGKNAAIEIDGVAYWMGNNGFFSFDGTVNTLPCSVEDFVYDDCNTTKGQQINAGINNLFTEVIWWYPTQSADFNDRYVVYNYGQDNARLPMGNWYTGTNTNSIRTSWIDSLVYPKPYATAYNSSNTGTFPSVIGETGLGQTIFFEHEIGTDQVNPDGSVTTLTSFIKSFSFSLQKDQAEVFLAMRRFLPNFKVLTGNNQITLAIKDFPSDDDEQTSLSPFTITSSTTKVDTRARGRYANIKIENTGVGESWRFGTFQVDLQPDGRRG